MDRVTIWDKANACATAWEHRYGSDPAGHVHAIEMVMSVALHETALGEAWGKSGNWGAIQRRAMTADEKALVAAGGAPTPRDPFEQIHGDSSPVTGKYAVWFYAFPAGVVTTSGLAGDVAGADKLLEVLLENRKSIKPRIDAIGAGELAALMYSTRYYEGIYDPHAMYEYVGGKWHKLTPDAEPTPGAPTSLGRDLDVADYAKALTSALAILTEALVGWTPGADPPHYEEPADPYDLSTVAGYQAALVAVGFGPLVIDGRNGPKTKASIEAWQASVGLDADGLFGPLSQARMRVAIAARGL